MMHADLANVSAGDRQVRALVMEIREEMECLTQAGTHERHQTAARALVVSWARLLEALSAPSAESPVPGDT